MNESKIVLNLNLTKGGNKIMSEKIKKFTGKRELPFVQIDREELQNSSLSLKATGLYALFCSFPSDWEIYKSDLTKRKKDGKDSVNGAFKELEKHGYLYVHKTRNERGQFDTTYYFFESPSLREEFFAEMDFTETTAKATEKAPAKAKAKKINLSEKLLEKLDGKTNAKAMETIKGNEEVISTLETLFRLDKKNKYQGEARPGEVVKVYLHTLKKGEVLTQEQIQIVDALLVEGYQAKPIMNAISKGFALGSDEFKKALENAQEFSNKMSEAIVEIKTLGAMDKSRMVKDQLDLKGLTTSKKNEKIETVGAFEGYNLDLLED